MAPDRSAAGTESLSRKYGHGYFHGQGSGYPQEGYRQAHPDWKAWLDWIALLQPAGILVDLGCAYGYLPAEARRRGYQAFGCDGSSYALSQEPAFQPFLFQAHLAHLPLPSAFADVVTLFDVLEHLEDPVSALREAVRILKPDGVLLGATPDPIFFDRREPTHCFERPPTFWLDALHRLGLEVRFRFSEVAYNFQFVAARAASPKVPQLDLFQHDYFGAERDFLQVEGRAFQAVPRYGWAPLEQGSRRMREPSASIYLLNQDSRPQRLSLQLQVRNSPGFSTLRLRLDSDVLQELHLDSEHLEQRVELADLLLPRGGHHLYFDLFPGGPQVHIAGLRLAAHPASPSELTETLPFDLYQRYRLSSRVAEVLRPDRILDAGGYLGDQYGHLAVPGDFFSRASSQAPQVCSTDLRQCDVPEHTPADACRQPFPDGAFDLVVSLDVLEHLPAERRLSFLQELDRVSRSWILLGAPFRSPQVEEAEKLLAERLLSARRFLREHRDLGLPERALVQDYFQSQRGYFVRAFPNGYLPRWMRMQALSEHYFGFRDYAIIRTFHRLYNRHCYPHDQVEPAYRTIFLISKQPWTAEQQEALDQIASTGRAEEPSWEETLAADPAFYELQERTQALVQEREKALLDVQFLINERQKLVEILDRTRRELEGTPWWRFLLRRFRER